jgi:hypothetical protein
MDRDQMSSLNLHSFSFIALCLRITLMWIRYSKRHWGTEAWMKAAKSGPMDTDLPQITNDMAIVIVMF